MNSTQPTQDPKYCEHYSCTRKVFLPYIYCDKHQDKSSTPLITPATKPLDEQIDELLKQFSDYGYHDNEGYGDCSTCKKISISKQAIKALIANAEKQARIDEVQRIDRYSALYKDIRLMILRGEIKKELEDSNE